MSSLDDVSGDSSHSRNNFSTTSSDLTKDGQFKVEDMHFSDLIQSSDNNSTIRLFSLSEPEPGLRRLESPHIEHELLLLPDFPKHQPPSTTSPGMRLNSS